MLPEPVSELESAYHLVPITAEQATQICGWTYGSGYGLCDFAAADRVSMLNPKHHYHTVWRADRLAGVACFGANARVFGGSYDRPALDLGCSMRPALVGHGRGADFLAAVVAFACESYQPPALRLTVAKSNQRAIQVFTKGGFVVERSFAGMTRSGIHRFFVMTRPTSRDR